jgi:CheY-like chemotaxis protein
MRSHSRFQDRSTPQPGRFSVSREAAGFRVLVVEDNPSNRLFLVRILSGVGFDVSAAEDGARAVALTRERRYDLILMDVEMPTMDGVQATSAIRSSRFGPNATPSSVPIIGISARNDPADRSRFAAAGMTAFLPKPFDARALRAVADAACRRTASCRNRTDERLDEPRLKER